MIKNYLKITFRNLVKNKVFSLINILGLATGISITLLISLWIWDEVTYDRSFTNHQQLAQIMTTTVGDDGKMSTDPRVCQPIADELRRKYGNDFKNISMSRWSGSALTVGDKTISGIGKWVEDKFPTMFSLNMLRGNINGLEDPSAIIMSASMAKTLFGNTDPIGKIIRLDSKDNYKVGCSRIFRITVPYTI